MNMKRFLAIGIAAVAFSFSGANTLAIAIAEDAGVASDHPEVEEIVVVCKTHFDIGYPLTISDGELSIDLHGYAPASFLLQRE